LFRQSCGCIEIGGLGIEDIERNTAFSLESIQMPCPSDLNAQGKILVDHYANVIIERSKQLSQVSTYLAVDGYFSKQSFVDQLMNHTNVELISKLRKDANLRYLYKGPKRKGRGRPKKYDGKVDPKNIDKRRFRWIYQDQDVIIFQAKVWSWSLKRTINVAYVEFIFFKLPD
jgi:hypothetical protein